MENLKQWHYEILAQKTVDSLKKNDIDAQYVGTSEEALKVTLKMIPKQASIGLGGSITIRQIGLVEKLKKEGYNLITKYDISDDERIKNEQRRQAILSDVYITSTNAVTIDGKLINIDGAGNRVASMIYGPQKVILLIGINKITRNVDEAINRTKEFAAVLNAKRHDFNTPCVTTGTCEDCNSPQRICRVTTIIEKKPKYTNLI